MATIEKKNINDNVTYLSGQDEIVCSNTDK